ncbi:MAG TPA: metallophosphoesterase [Bryobacteraceae bacterium]|nr:metallophosphoesterase [Bryobacteraceae bacterium]
MSSLHPSGALWLPASRTVLLADLHLGFAWAQRRRGELWPLTDAGARTGLEWLCDQLLPARIVLVGDIVHAPFPSAEEAAVIDGTLDALRARAELICLAGNHDRGRGFLPEWRTDGLRAIHGDRLPGTAEPGVLTVVGHFHPILKLRDASGVKRRHRAFLRGNGLLVLPAFSPFASGTDMREELPLELRAWFGDGPVEVTLTSGEKLLSLGIHHVAAQGLRRG